MCICIDGKQKAIVINQFPSLASPMASITLEPNLGNDIFFQPENDTPDMFEEGMKLFMIFCINYYNSHECEFVPWVSYFI